MTEQEFMEFFHKYIKEEILPTMIGKGLGQYSNQDNRFHNFEQLEKLKKESREKSLTDLVGKQIVCLYDTMRLWKGPLTPRLNNLLNEVIKDIIIYMFLLRGMIKDLELDERCGGFEFLQSKSEEWK